MVRQLPRQSCLDRFVRKDLGGGQKAVLREAAMDYEITVNGTSRTVSARPDTPLLYVLMNDLQLKGPRFGCGLAQCGSCSVLLDGVEIRSCITAVGDVQGKSLTTLEGLPALYAQQKGLAQIPALHPLQQAFIDVQAPQCGYCYNGMTIKGSELLAKDPKPTEAQIRAHMDGHLCRCGTYPRVMKAIQLASSRMAGDGR
jgi:aerobic-type carbon monoxide dehydrogenase small subunit (CoxS/CutS family)